MVKMTFDKYDELMEKFEVMPNSLHDYGITNEDIERMENEPEKYLQFAMYLSTRAWYIGKGDNSHVFINADALNPTEVVLWLKDFLNHTISFCDTDKKHYDESEMEAMKALFSVY